jgi:hypothetical protein
MALPEDVRRLVDRFQEHRADYESSSYLEARVRVDFINPFFAALGWDVDNRLNRSESSRDVVTEGRIRSGGGMKAPDYLFRVGGSPAFVLEAKKPSVNLRLDPLPALQLRRYGWNSKEYAVGILADFQEFAVYDCTITPTSSDNAEMAKIDYCTFEDYPRRWDDIAAKFSRESVAAGSLDEYAKTFAARRGQSEVDKVFLSELNGWRSRLARELALYNSLDEESLNYATQVLIDRIIFLRICEDRGIEQYGQLRDDVDRPGIYTRLQAAFQRADEKYNSGLFHLRPEPGRPGYDDVTPALTVSDEVLSTFIERLYWPKGPYDFRVLPADVLGQVYEQFLGKRISELA